MVHETFAAMTPAERRKRVRKWKAKRAASLLRQEPVRHRKTYRQEQDSKIQGLLRVWSELNDSDQTD